MKMTKKWLLAAAALALVFNFASCKTEDDDDDSISGSKITVDNTTKTIDGVEYTKVIDGYWATADGTKSSNAATTKRAYSSTKLKHLGTLARLELYDQDAYVSTNDSDGVVGVMWDLKTAKTARKQLTDDKAEVDEATEGVLDDTADALASAFDESKAINFFIIGFKYQNGKLGYYISKFYNVFDVNGQNFGAGSSTTTDNDAAIRANTTTEQIIVNASSTTAGLDGTTNFKVLQAVTPDADGTVYVWADIYPANTKYGLHKADHTTTGEFIVDIYVGADTPTAETTPTETVVITTAQTGYTTTIKQAKPARYGNALPGKKMSGYVKYQKTYAEDEVIEE